MKCKRLFAALGAAVITLSAVTTADAQARPGDTPPSAAQINTNPMKVPQLTRIVQSDDGGIAGPGT